MFRKLWYILTLRCEEADRLRSQQALEPLTRVERVAMSLHQLVCKSCRIAARQIRLLDEAISKLREDSNTAPAAETSSGLSAEARDRLEAAIRRAEASEKKSD